MRFDFFGSLLGLMRLDLDFFFSFFDFLVTMSRRLAYFGVSASSFDLESSSELEFHLNSIELELSSELDILRSVFFESLSRLKLFGVGLEYILLGFRALVLELELRVLEFADPELLRDRSLGLGFSTAILFLSLKREELAQFKSNFLVFNLDAILSLMKALSFARESSSTLEAWGDDFERFSDLERLGDRERSSELGFCRRAL